jgi:putative nucleotidyltransferase with HDIG domain
LGAWFPKLLIVDDTFAEEYLLPVEYRLYRKMDRRDRHHAYFVAKTLLAHEPGASSVLVRAALLHDVGKVRLPFRLWQRIAVHLYTPRRLPSEPPMRGLRGAWQVKLHHAQYGAEMIRLAGGGEAVAELVARHHRPGEDAQAELLKRIDEKT